MKGKQMKFADVEGKRREAQPGCSAECPNCGRAVIAKCGQHRVWHWAHRGIRTCDTWWEPETEWHRAWKNQFPAPWQEVGCRANEGERHVADVKTESGLVLEFQHSFLHRDERESRETFYQNMVWVVDGRRRARDRARFFASLEAANVIMPDPLTFLLRSSDGALLRDWGGSRVPVYFDFGDLGELDDALLWRLNPRTANERAYLSRVPKTLFLEVHLKGVPFEDLCTGAIERVAARYLMQQAPRPRPLVGFERYMARRQRARPRF
jgi:competence protein CoiA